MENHEGDSGRATFLGALLLTLTGIGVFAGSVLLCGGMAFAFVGIVAAMGLFALLHFFLWGSAFNREVENERAAEEFRRLVEDSGDESRGSEPFGHPRR